MIPGSNKDHPSFLKSFSYAMEGFVTAVKTERNIKVMLAAGACTVIAGCIVGLHEVLVRQGLMASRRTLDPHEDLSPGQLEEIERVYRAYPHLNDDAFVREHLDEWLR